MSYPYIIRIFPLKQGLDHQSAGTATAVADADAAKLALLCLEDTDQGGQNASTTGTKRVTDGNSTTVDVDLILGEAEQLHVGQSDNTEGLVDLEGVNRLLGHASVLQSLGDSQGGGGGELAGLLLGITPAADLSDGLQAKLLDLSLGHQDDGSGTVVQRGRVRCSHSAGAGDESGLHGAQLLGVELEKELSIRAAIRHAAL